MHFVVSCCVYGPGSTAGMEGPEDQKHLFKTAFKVAYSLDWKVFWPVLAVGLVCQKHMCGIMSSKVCNSVLLKSVFTSWMQDREK